MAREIAAVTQEERMRRAAVLKTSVDLSFVSPDMEETLLELEAVAHVMGLGSSAGDAADAPEVAALLARVEALARGTADPVHLVQFLRHVRFVYDGTDGPPALLVVARLARPLLLRRLHEAARAPMSLEAALRSAVRLAPFCRDALEDAGEAMRGVGRALAASSDLGALEGVPERDLGLVSSALRAAAEGGYVDSNAAERWRAAAAELEKRRAAERRAARRGRRQEVDPAAHAHCSSPRARSGRLAASAAAAPRGPPRRFVSLLPPHCQLTSSPVCCICADLRSYAPAYEKYVDGVGFVQTASRSEFYCGACREAAGTAAGEAAGRHNRLVVASLGPGHAAGA
eukprot:tig00020902_g15017.t1